MSNDIPNTMLKMSSKPNTMTFEQTLNFLKNKKPIETNIGGSIVKSGDVINEGDNQGILEGSLAQDNGLGRGAVIGGETQNKGLNTHHMKSGDVINTGMNQGVLQGGATINEHTNNYGMYSGSVINDGVNESEMEGGKSHNKGQNNNNLIGSNLHNTASGNNHKDAFMKGKDAVRNLQKGITPYKRAQGIIEQQEIINIENRIEGLKNEANGLEKNLELRQDKLRKNNENTILDTQNLDVVKRNLNNINRELSDVTSQLNEKKSEIIKLNKDIKDKEQKIKSLTDSLDGSNKIINDLTNNWESAKKDAREKNSELQNCLNRKKELLLELQTLPQIPAQFSSFPNDSSTLELITKNQELADLTIQKGILEKDLKKARDERNSYKKSMEIAKENCTKTQQEINDLKNTCLQFKNNLENATKSLNDIHNSTNKVQEVINETLELKLVDKKLESTSCAITTLTDGITIKPKVENSISESKTKNFDEMNHRVKRSLPTEVIMGGGLSNSGVNHGTVKGGDTVHIKRDTSVTNNNLSVLPVSISKDTVEQLSSSLSGFKEAVDYVIDKGQIIINGASYLASTVLSIIPSRSI